MKVKILNNNKIILQIYIQIFNKIKTIQMSYKEDKKQKKEKINYLKIYLNKIENQLKIIFKKKQNNM